MPSTIDWPAIRVQYEQHGISKSTLAQVHNVSRQAIQQRAQKEHWITPLLAAPANFLAPLQAPTSTETEKLSDLEIVEKAIADLYKHLAAGHLELNQHKLFADALSQYTKIKLTTPSDKPTESGVATELLPYFTSEQLHQWSELEAQQDAILEAVQAKRLEAEQGIKSIRKSG